MPGIEREKVKFRGREGCRRGRWGGEFLAEELDAAVLQQKFEEGGGRSFDASTEEGKL